MSYEDEEYEHPGHIRNLAAWYETDQGITQSGGTCSQLADLSGKGRHFAQATATKQPSVIASGAASILRFTGLAAPNNTYLQAAPFGLVQPWHLFIAAAYTKAAGATYLCDGNNGAGGTNLGVVYHNGVNAEILALAPTTGAGPVFTTATWAVFEVLFSNTASQIALNGGTQINRTLGANNPNGLTIGAAGNGAVPAQADVYAMIAYSAALTEQQRQRVIRYLRRKAARAGLVIP